MSLLKCLVEASSIVQWQRATPISHHPNRRLVVLTNALLSSNQYQINDTIRNARKLGPQIEHKRTYRQCSLGLDKSFPTLRVNSSQVLGQVLRQAISFKRFTTTNNNNNTTNNSDCSVVRVLPKRSLRPIRKKRPLVGVTELPEESKMVWPKITLFGDSLTRRAFDVENGCWGSMLANKLGDYFDVDARGFAGYNTNWAYDQMPKLFPKSYLAQVEIFVLLFGHNDSWESSNPLHVPVDQYEKNINKMVQYLLENGLSRSKIILITPNWYDLPAFTQYHLDQGLPLTKKEFRDTVKYGEAVIRIARKEQIDYLDAFTLSYKHDPLAELFCDGVHYSLKGAKLLFEHLWPIVDRKVAEAFRKPSNQLFHATPWDEIPSVKAVIEAHNRRLEAETRARRGY